SASSRATLAAPVTLGVDAYKELTTVLPSGEGSAPVVEEPRRPAKVVVDHAAQDGLHSGGSMHGSPSTLVGPSGNAATALTSVAVAYQPTLFTVYLLQEGRIDIPPRFLDGIFRPPRMV
ncbi:MAG: hypothetical protein KF861_22380, partial [Planctomycetaceae bacterium]|nr:hypothetical protein [Planctomycetaceae bacterium]